MTLDEVLQLIVRFVNALKMGSFQIHPLWLLVKKELMNC